MKKFLLFVSVLLLVGVLAFTFTTPALAQACDPATDVNCVIEEPSPPDATNPSLPDVAVLIAIVAFIKERVELSKNGVAYAVIGVGAFLWFTPLLATWLPQFAFVIDQILAFVKWILVAMGSIDLVVNVGAKIAKVNNSVINMDTARKG